MMNLPKGDCLMNCPVCDGVRMREVEKNGVLIDICPNCKGVWLDRGELDKLMSEIQEQRPAYEEFYNHRYEDQSARHTHQGNSQYSDVGYNKDSYKRKKKKSVLDVFGDLFD